MLSEFVSIYVQQHFLIEVSGLILILVFQVLHPYIIVLLHFSVPTNMVCLNTF